jgi:hypothetical protein
MLIPALLGFPLSVLWHRAWRTLMGDGRIRSLPGPSSDAPRTLPGRAKPHTALRLLLDGPPTAGTVIVPAVPADPFSLRVRRPRETAPPTVRPWP